jgi:ankyrin repeat protein
LEAVKHGNMEMVNMILNSSVELKEVLFHQKLNDGSTALMLAIETQNLELIRIMMENNVKEDPKNDGTTILMRLVSNNLFELAKHFLNNGHDLFAKDGMGGDLLSIALDYKIFYQAGGKLFLEFLFENGFSPNHEMETRIWSGGKILLTVFQKIQNQTDLAMNMIQKGAEYVKFQHVYFIQSCTKKIKQFGGEIQDPTELVPYQNDPVKYLFL